MEYKAIDGIAYKKLLAGGLSSLNADIERINDLNVFPIPDGDTGFNMYSTLLNGYKAAESDEGYLLHKAAKLVNDGMLLGARGNSGVILSQFFAGINAEFEKHERADVVTLSKAFDLGVQYAYSAVSEPVEGTMLTVVRDGAKYAIEKAKKDDSILKFFENFVEEAERSVERTPSLLPVLKEAGVVDSGGAGIVCIFKGFIDAMYGRSGEHKELLTSPFIKELDFSLFNENSVMQFGYCTEFLLQLTHAKTDIAAFSLEDMKKKLSSFGDSIVAVKTGTIVKVHVHTLNPGEVLSYAQGFGEFLTLKIENMTLQHNETVKAQEPAFKKNLTRKPYRLVAVADGEGMISTYKELGADLVIEGGQGRNPSVETFIDAFDAVNGDNIFVLPNNDNVIMAAEKAASLYKKSSVRVINSRNMGEGYAALSSLDYTCDNAEEIAKNMEKDIKSSCCATVSVTIRDLNNSSAAISAGEYIGFVGKKIISSSKEKVDAAISALENLDAENKSFIVAFYGKKVTEDEKSDFSKRVTSLFKNAEFYPMDAGQDVYDFILVLQ